MRIGLGKIIKKFEIETFGENVKILKQITSDPWIFGKLSYNIAWKVALNFESILMIFYLVKLS